MKVTAEKIEDSQVVLNIELDPEQVEQGLDKAYRRLVTRMTIPGFRKGKAPRRMFERYVGRSALLEEALDRILPDIYSQALTEQNIDAIAEPRFEVLELEPVKVKATVPVRPTVELGDYRSVRVETEPVTISEERIQEVLEQIRKEETPWEPVERPIQAGDRVTLDLKQSRDGGPPLKDQDVDYLVLPENERPLPGFAEQLIGLGPGETKTFTLQEPKPVPAEQPEEGAEGAKAEAAAEATPATYTFEVAVKEIKAQRLPEIDDEWAKGVGEGFDSLAALRERIETNLRRQAEANERSRVEDEVVRKVVEGARVEFPPVLVEHEIEHMWRDQESELRANRLSMDDFLRLTRRTAEGYRDELRPRARERVKTGLVLGKVAEAEAITVEPEEIDREVRQIVRASGSGESAEQLFGSEPARDSIRQALLTRKTVRRLVAIATEGKMTYPAAEEEAAADEAALQPAETADVEEPYTTGADDESIAADEAAAASAAADISDTIRPDETDDITAPFTTGAEDASVSADELKDAGSSAPRESST